MSERTSRFRKGDAASYWATGLTGEPVVVVGHTPQRVKVARWDFARKQHFTSIVRETSLRIGCYTNVDSRTVGRIEGSLEE